MKMWEQKTAHQSQNSTPILFKFFELSKNQENANTY